MSAVVIVKGQIRTIRELRRREPDERGNRTAFGRSFSILTDAHGHLGETLEITVFSGDLVSIPNAAQVSGARVEWVAEVSASQYGLRATYKGQAVEDVFSNELQIPALEEVAA